MKRDFTQANGTKKRIQVSHALRKGKTTMGTKYKKGDAIIHLSSSRTTGEVWVFTPQEFHQIWQDWPTGRWWSRKKWKEELSWKWNKIPRERLINGFLFDPS